MSEFSPAPLRIDIVSDVVCPWCIVGYRQLARALEATGIEAEVHWHPFELNPQMGPEGQNLTEHITEKYGITREDSAKNRARLAAVGAELGFAFNFTDASRMVNTFRAHQAIHWAGKLGRQHDMKQALFTAYFTDQRDVSDPAVLRGVAEGLGLDGAALEAALDTEALTTPVREAERFWTSRGISGVPGMVFEGKYLVTGAQGAETYAEILRQLTAEAA